MQDLERDVANYVRGLVQERLANDPMRLHAFLNLSALLENNPDYSASQRSAMIHNMFGFLNFDLAQVFYSLVQGKCDDRLFHSPPEIRSAKLNKVAKMCWCIQFMDLFRQRFSVHAPDFTTLSNAVHMFTIDQIPESTLSFYLSRVLLHAPNFRSQLEAKVSHLTSLFDVGDESGESGDNGGAAGNNNAGSGNNPPPQD